MPQVGSRTTTTDLWMLEEDVAAFGTAVQQVAPAPWICSQAGPADVAAAHRHPDLPEALRCGGVQAFLPLPLGAAVGEALAEVQYLHTRRLAGDSLGRMGDHLRSGWLAVRWYVDDVGDAEPLLIEQRRAVWAALRSATHPCRLRHLHTEATHKSARIGGAAKRLAQEESLTLRLHYQPYRLDDARR